MPESTVELLKKAVASQSKVIDRPQPERRILVEEAAQPKKERGKD